jgi:hypothetical protein
LGYPALASIIGRMEPSLILELNNGWIGSFSSTFSQLFLIFCDFLYQLGVFRLYFIGLPFLHTSKSGLLHVVGDDAAYVVEHIALLIVL